MDDDFNFLLYEKKYNEYHQFFVSDHFHERVLNTEDGNTYNHDTHSIQITLIYNATLNKWLLIYRLLGLTLSPVHSNTWIFHTTDPRRQQLNFDRVQCMDPNTCIQIEGQPFSCTIGEPVLFIPS